MTKAPTETQTQRRTALLMAVYTCLLALGAALPVAASYGEAFAQRTAEGEVQGGGYRRDVETPVACEEAEQAVRPQNTAEITPAELETTTPEMDEAAECSTPDVDARGS